MSLVIDNKDCWDGTIHLNAEEFAKACAEQDRKLKEYFEEYACSENEKRLKELHAKIAQLKQENEILKSQGATLDNIPEPNVCKRFPKYCDMEDTIF